MAGVYPKHILFVERAEKKKRLRVYDIDKETMHMIEVKYETAGLSFDAQYLLVSYGERLAPSLPVSCLKLIKPFGRQYFVYPSHSDEEAHQEVQTQEYDRTQMDFERQRVLLGRHRGTILAMVLLAEGRP